MKYLIFLLLLTSCNSKYYKREDLKTIGEASCIEGYFQALRIDYNENIPIKRVYEGENWCKNFINEKIP